MESQTTVCQLSLEQLNTQSEANILQSYLTGYCSGVWIVNRDDDEELK